MAGTSSTCHTRPESRSGRYLQRLAGGKDFRPGRRLREVLEYLAYRSVWSGDAGEGERRLAPLRAFGRPLADTVQIMPYVAAQSMLDAAVPYGRHNYWKSGFLRELPDDAGRVVGDCTRAATSPWSLCLIEHVHGAPTRVPVDATAFSVRDEHFHCIVVSSWDAGDAAAPHVQWARDFWGAMHAWSAGRVYMNILGQDEEDRVREAYGPAYSRLQAVKATYDAANVFTVNHNIRPLAAGVSVRAD